MRRLFLWAAALWLALNLLTLTAYPTAWVDEILFADPAMHLAAGKGFVSSVWFNQASTEFWAGYTPLYSFVLAGWLKLSGVSAFAVRSFSLTLVMASLLMVWLFLKQLARNLSPWPIILALAVCEPLAFLERAGRPDSLSLALLTGTALVFIQKPGRWRSVLLFLFGALAVPSALQYAAGVVVLGALLQIWFKPFTKRDIALWATGAATGAAVLIVIYAAHHVLKLFIEVTLVSKHSTIGRLLQNVVLGSGESPFVLPDIASASFHDYATPVLLLAGVTVAIVEYRRDRSLTRADRLRSRRLGSFGVACAFLIPLAIQLLGKYPLYYTYLGAVPATIAIFLACEQIPGRAAILALLLAGGTGKFWWQAWRQGPQTIAIPATLVSPSDVVVADYPAYYQLFGHTRELFGVDYAGGKLLPHFPPDQAADVTKLIVRDSRFNEVLNKVGGEWQRIFVSGPLIFDDDTRHPKTEKIGIYVRALKSQSDSTTTAVP